MFDRTMASPAPSSALVPEPGAFLPEHHLDPGTQDAEQHHVSAPHVSGDVVDGSPHDVDGDPWRDAPGEPSSPTDAEDGDHGQGDHGQDDHGQDAHGDHSDHTDHGHGDTGW